MKIDLLISLLLPLLDNKIVIISHSKIIRNHFLLKVPELVKRIIVL